MWISHCLRTCGLSSFAYLYMLCACPYNTHIKQDFMGTFKGGRVMIAFFLNYSTVAFLLHLPTLKRQQFVGAVANSLGKNSYFPLPLDVRRCVAPTGEEVDARQRGVN